MDVVVINRPLSVNEEKGLVWSDMFKSLTGTVNPENSNVSIYYAGHDNVTLGSIMIVGRCLTPTEAEYITTTKLYHQHVSEAVVYMPVEMFTPTTVTDVINNNTYTI